MEGRSIRRDAGSRRRKRPTVAPIVADSPNLLRIAVLLLPTDAIRITRDVGNGRATRVDIPVVIDANRAPGSIIVSLLLILSPRLERIEVLKARQTGVAIYLRG